MPIVVGKRAGTPEGGAVVIDLSDGVERHLVCEVQGGRAAMVQAPTNPPLCRIGLSTEAFLVLATGRRSADQVSAAVEGDADLAGKVLGQFNMMI